MKIIESSQARLLGLFENGAARSAAKLAALSGTRWKVYILSMDVGSGERFRALLSRDGREHTGFHFSSAGEKYLVAFSADSGKAILESYARGRGEILDAEREALAEIANVVVNGISGELADRQGMARVISAPTSVRGTKIYESAFAGLDGEMIDVLIRISSPALTAECTLMLRLDALTATFLLSADPDALPEFALI